VHTRGKAGDDDDNDDDDADPAVEWLCTRADTCARTWFEIYIYIYIRTFRAHVTCPTDSIIQIA